MHLRKGEIFTSENIKVVRPGYGMNPKYYFNILGKKALVDCKFGAALKKNMFSK